MLGAVSHPPDVFPCRDIRVAQGVVFDSGPMVAQLAAPRGDPGVAPVTPIGIPVTVYHSDGYVHVPIALMGPGRHEVRHLQGASAPVGEVSMGHEVPLGLPPGVHHGGDTACSSHVWGAAGHVTATIPATSAWSNLDSGSSPGGYPFQWGEKGARASSPESGRPRS